MLSFALDDSVGSSSVCAQQATSTSTSTAVHEHCQEIKNHSNTRGNHHPHHHQRKAKRQQDILTFISASTAGVTERNVLDHVCDNRYTCGILRRPSGRTRRRGWLFLALALPLPPHCA